MGEEKPMRCHCDELPTGHQGRIHPVSEEISHHRALQMHRSPLMFPKPNKNIPNNIRPHLLSRSEGAAPGLPVEGIDVKLSLRSHPRHGLRFRPSLGFVVPVVVIEILHHGIVLASACVTDARPGRPVAGGWGHAVVVVVGCAFSVVSCHYGDYFVMKKLCKYAVIETA